MNYLQHQGTEAAAAGKQRDASSNRKPDEQIQEKNDNQNLRRIASEHEVTPIIFEECYVKNQDFRFVQ